MKLLSLELNDFRQFKGSQTLRFAAGKDRTVTLLYGANGTGKTTILNAFTWALYGEFTPDLEHPERPINLQVWKEAEVGQPLEASVELTFEHQGADYVVRRSIRTKKTSETQAIKSLSGEVELGMTDETGAFSTKSNPADALDQILPERLHRFFFFNGERIERLAQHTAYEEIEEATKTLLGLEVLDRAVKHLPKVAAKFQAELKEVGSSEQKALASEKEGVVDQISEKGDEIDQCRRNLAELHKETEVVEERLRDLADARALQEERTKLEQAFEVNKDKLATRRDEIQKLISERGYIAFAPGLAEFVSDRFNDLESRGELPTPVKRPFINQLLDDGRCICGAHLVEGEEAYELVAKERDRAGLADVEQRWTRLANGAEHLMREREDLRNGIDQHLALLAEIRSEQSGFEERLSEISRKLGNFPSEEIQELERRHKSLREQESSTQKQEGRLTGDLVRLKEELKEVETKLLAAEAKTQEARLAQQRIAVTDEAQEAFGEIYGVLQHEVRQELDARIKQTFSTISFKERIPELNENFELRLWDPDHDGQRVPAAKSTGENMILSLSFVGGLASLARDQEEQTSSGSLEALLSGVGGTYPIVMDAAFGNLDEDYREHVARALPKLAPQTVILVSKAQASDEVERELRDEVGRQYVISYRTAKAGEDEAIEVAGREYPYKVSTTPEDERAELVEIGDGG